MSAKLYLYIFLFLVSFSSFGNSFQEESGLCLDVDKKTNNVLAFPCHGMKNQEWKWVGAHLKSVYNNKCLHIHPNLDVGAYPCQDWNSQFWSMKNGQIINSQGKCLDRRKNDNNIIAYACHGGGNQHWTEKKTKEYFIKRLSVRCKNKSKIRAVTSCGSNTCSGSAWTYFNWVTVADCSDVGNPNYENCWTRIYKKEDYSEMYNFLYEYQINPRHDFNQREYKSCITRVWSKSN